MLAARIANMAFLALIIPVAALVFVKTTWAASGNVQICNPSANCTIGEFLYDDSYNPITAGATCTITSRYPDGTYLLNNVSLTASSQGDGWYAHSFTAPTTLGLYRTTISCIVSGQTMALDKSFEVQTAPSTLSASDVSSAVWSYSSRSLSTFGTLISDIWNNATRTLTRADLSSGKLATQSDVTSAKDEATSAKNDAAAVKSDVSTIKSDVSSIKDTVGTINTTTTTTTTINNISNNLLEQVINKPIIENGLEAESSTTTIDLQSKLEKSNSLANQMLTSGNYLKSKVNLISYRWDSLDSSQINSSISSLISLVGNENDDLKSNSLFGQINWIKSQWDIPVSEKLYQQNQKLSQKLTSINQGTLQTKQVSASIDSLIKLIGTRGDTSKNTLFGQLNEKRQLSQALDKSYTSVNKLLKDWNYSSQDAEGKADRQIIGQVLALSKEVSAVNLLPKVNSLLSFQPSSSLTQKQLRNKTLDLRGIIDANKQFLALNPSKPFSSFWLGEGSIVFKTLITNPSSKISQTVPLKYYLPKEVTREDVTKIDEGLSINYDMEKDQYFVKGEFTLAPKESKTVSVTVDDSIFHISDQEIATMRRQAQELSEPLKNTAYFAQGVTLQSDIDASLDKVEALQKDGITPEAKIKAYRDAQIEFKAAGQKLEKLKELATSAGSVGTLFGFVGGAQVMAVWGLIIIMIAGFVFLALYMRSIRTAGIGVENVDTTPMQINKKISKKEGKNTERDDVVTGERHHFFSGPVKLAVIAVSLTLLGGTAAFMVLNPKYSKEVRTEVAYEKPVTKEHQASSSAVLGTVSEDSKTGEKATIFVPKDSIVSVHSNPSLNSPVLMDLTSSTEALAINQKETWVKVRIGQTEGWVDIDFIEKKDFPSDALPKPQGGISETQGFVTVKDTPTGFLRVRDSIWGTEITKVSPGEEFTKLGEKSGWLQIMLEDGTKGWITKEYAIPMQ